MKPSRATGSLSDCIEPERLFSKTPTPKSSKRRKDYHELQKSRRFELLREIEISIRSIACANRRIDGSADENDIAYAMILADLRRRYENKNVSVADMHLCSMYS